MSYSAGHVVNWMLRLVVEFDEKTPPWVASLLLSVYSKERLRQWMHSISFCPSLEPLMPPYFVSFRPDTPQGI